MDRAYIYQGHKEEYLDRTSLIRCPDGASPYPFHLPSYSLVVCKFLYDMSSTHKIISAGPSRPMSMPPNRKSFCSINPEL